MKISKIPVSLALVLVLVGSSSCDKFLDINKDPINPTDVQINLLLPASQAAMATGLGNSIQGLGQPAAAITQQLVNGRVGAYALDGNSFNNQWLTLYVSTLENNELVINKGTATSAWAYVGIAQIQKAYVFSQMVDVWGDIPYTDALKGAAVPAPKFDDDEAIYTDLFRLITEGTDNLRRTDGTRNPGTDDLVYGGDRAKWIRLGNTLKLKLYNQIRLTRNVAADVTPLLANSTDLITAADDFEFRYGLNSGSPENRHPGFQGDYAGSSRENFINLYFYNLMKNTSDPRIPYYFFNQVAAATPLTTVDYQDGKFITLRFGSIGTQNATNTTNNRTLQGLYPIGGRYDNGVGVAVTGTSAKGSVAQRFITFFMRKYVEAELQLMVLNSPTNARVALEDALNASFAKVNAVATTDGSPTIAPAAIAVYVNAALARYNAAATNEAKLNVIITEKYIANFGTGTDVYTDYRRTGYPAIPDADTDGDPQTVKTGDFPVRFPYRINDLLTNPNAPQQINYTTDKIFWDR